MEYSYDLNKLYDQCNNDKEFINKMLTVYKEELISYQYQLRTGLKNADLQVLKNTTHSMIPAMKLLGADVASKDLRLITDSILIENSVHPFIEKINSIALFCEELQEALSTE